MQISTSLLTVSPAPNPSPAPFPTAGAVCARCPPCSILRDAGLGAAIPGSFGCTGKRAAGAGAKRTGKKHRERPQRWGRRGEGSRQSRGGPAEPPHRSLLPLRLPSHGGMGPARSGEDRVSRSLPLGEHQYQNKRFKKKFKIK